jgi:hypothetical protein
MINKNSDQIMTLVFEGISLINMGKFFDAHETLESAWHLEKAPIRTLYKGLIQFSVACFHAERKNWIGAMRVLLRARGNLAPFIQEHSMIDVSDVLLQIDNLSERINRVSISNDKNQELLISPHVKIKGASDEPINPESG